MKTNLFSRMTALILAVVLVLSVAPSGAIAAERAEVVQWNVTLAAMVLLASREWMATTVTELAYSVATRSK